MATRNLADMGNRTHAQYVKTAVQQLPNGRNNLHVLHTRCVLQWISKFQPHLFGKNWTINSMIFGGRVDLDLANLEFVATVATGGRVKVLSAV